MMLLKMRIRKPGLKPACRLGFLFFITALLCLPSIPGNTLSRMGTEWHYGLIWIGNTYKEAEQDSAPHPIKHTLSISLPFSMGNNTDGHREPVSPGTTPRETGANQNNHNRFTFAPGLTLFWLPLHYSDAHNMALPMEVERPDFQYTIFPVIDLPLRIALFGQRNSQTGISVLGSLMLPFPIASRGSTDTGNLFSYLYGSGRFFYPGFELWTMREITPNMALRIAGKMRVPVSNLWDADGIPITHRMTLSLNIGLFFPHSTQYEGETEAEPEAEAE